MELIWFPGNIRPAYPGVYLRDVDEWTGFSYWNGECWFAVMQTIKEALSTIKSGFQNSPWAGIALTKFFGYSPTPVRNGVYEILPAGYADLRFFALWKENTWYYPEKTPEAAAVSFRKTNRLHCWRGMLYGPEKET